ncbi:MAG: GNAT family N-acetyltransferase [Flavobacteriales bacterium]|nr:GNAT family N-acetyltransferase [Flavobacteriales bacterium]NQX98856.1 GNAT family N-acetyltransferase [Flavobacteriales bacterium]
MEKELIVCRTSEQFSLAKKLTIDYMNWLGVDLYYQGIDKEHDTFHIMYNYPEGCFIYILINDELAGGVGVRRLEDNICEMKRLYVYDKFKGDKLGLFLCNKLIEIAKELGYQKMRLDTLPTLKNALQLYSDLGFYKIPKYYNNPDERVVYLEIDFQNKA